MKQMCAWAGVSTSGFYNWRSRPLSATAKRRAELRAVILQVFSDSQGTYGYRRVHAVLQRVSVQAEAELVHALMRELDLVPYQQRPWRATTIADDAAPATPDLLARDFTADAPGRKLVSDITYVHTWAGFLYLATVIDCHTKAVVGWAMAHHMKTSLISDALDIAARNIDLAEGCNFVASSARWACERRSAAPVSDGTMRWLNHSSAASRTNYVPNTRTCPPGDRPLHRDVLQSKTPPLRTRLQGSRSSPRRVRGVAGSGIRRTFNTAVREAQGPQHVVPASTRTSHPGCADAAGWKPFPQTTLCRMFSSASFHCASFSSKRPRKQGAGKNPTTYRTSWGRTSTGITGGPCRVTRRRLHTACRRTLAARLGPLHAGTCRRLRGTPV